MVICRSCKKECAVEEMHRSGGKYRDTCKNCHAYRMRCKRKRNVKVKSRLAIENAEAFTAGLQFKNRLQSKAGFRFPLEHAQDPSRRGWLYVRRWEYHRDPVVEVLAAFESECVGFDLWAVPDSGVALPLELSQLSLRIAGSPEAYAEPYPEPTQVFRPFGRSPVRLSLIRGTWECQKITTEAVARQFVIELRYLKLLIHRGGWKRLVLKPADLDALAERLGVPPFPR